MSNYRILKRLAELGYDKPLLPEAFVDGNNFIIFVKSDNKSRPIESQPSREKAEKACNILNEHTFQMNVPTTYYYEELL